MNEGFKVSNRREHLKEGVAPIVAHINTLNDLGIYHCAVPCPPGAESRQKHNVDFNASPEELNKENFLNAGPKTYVISTVDGHDKFTEGLADCTSLIVVGAEAGSGKNISFLTHEFPQSDKVDELARDIAGRLAEIKGRCEPGTIDAVIVGGTWAILIPNRGKTNFEKNYLDSINLISREVEEVLGFKPFIPKGPKLEGGKDSIYFSNNDRQLYITSTEKSAVEGFAHSDVGEVGKKLGELVARREERYRKQDEEK